MRLCLASLLVVAACGGDSSGGDSGTGTDTGTGVDSGMPGDGGATDMGTPDMGAPDLGPPTCSALMMGTDACGMCVGSMCCPQYTACQADTTCSTFQTCVDGCSGGDMTCVTNCMTAAGGSTTVAGYITCVTTTCSGSCS